MDETAKTHILRVIQRMPEWIRHDLGSKDAGVRARAEETLIAMIAEVPAKNPESET